MLPLKNTFHHELNRYENKKKKCRRGIFYALGVKKILPWEARGTNPLENRLSLCHIVCNCFSFLPLQQPVNIWCNQLTHSREGKSYYSCLRQTDMEADRCYLRNTPTHSHPHTHTKKSWTLDCNWDYHQVLGKSLLLAVLKRHDYYRSSDIDIFPLFLAQSTLQQQPAWRDTFVSILRKWKIWTVFSGIQKEGRNTNFLFVPVGSQLFVKFTFMTVEQLNMYVVVVEQDYDNIAIKLLVTVIWASMVRFLFSNPRNWNKGSSLN